MRNIKLITTLTLLLMSSNVIAGQSIGKITFLALSDQGHVQVITETRGTNIPECATDPERLAADINTEYGQAVFSMLLAAQAQGLDVQVGGKNSCNIRSNQESIQYVIIRP